MNLQSKTAVVTGAGKGLGAALCYALIEKGTKVYGLARTSADLDLLKKELGERFTPVSMDITDRTAVVEWIDSTFSDSYSPDILINNAGAGYFGKIDELSLEHWSAMINTNLNGLFYMTSQIVPLMKRKDGFCYIINMGSILGKTTRSEGSAYSLTKYGIQGFSETLAKELRWDKIKVSCVNPGSIATHFFEDSGIQPNEHMLSPKDLAYLIITILETPDNLLVDEITVRPLIPKARN